VEPEIVEEPKVGEPGNKRGRGRPPGIASRRNIADLLKVEQVLEAKNYDPIAELIAIAQAEGATLEKRQEIALVIMPYVYSRQPAYVASSQDGEDEGGLKMSFTVSL
jgi:hypothetical protein